MAVGVNKTRKFQFTPLREGRRAKATAARMKRTGFQFTPLREGRRSSASHPTRGIYFNSRPSARGDLPCALIHVHTSKFQFTPLREGRRRSTVSRKWRQKNFNSRPSARGDWSACWCFYCKSVISIHAPPRGATSILLFRMSRNVFQFTPLREGRHSESKSYSDGAISIHAPPRGATEAIFMYSAISLFQFTPLREGRQFHLCLSERFVYFNSRPSARGDEATNASMSAERRFQFTPLREGRRDLPYDIHEIAYISIHAPPRGATDGREAATPRTLDFNSRPSARGDAGRQTAPRHGSNFNSRPSARGDRNQAGRRLCVRYFNSRPSARGDCAGARCTVCSGKFQFTPLREGRRRICPPRRWRFPISIHAPPRGATGRPFLAGCTNPISIHAPPRGATAGQQTAPQPTAISIHAPPRGATAKDMQFLQIFCSTLTNQHGLTIVPRNLSRLFW